MDEPEKPFACLLAECDMTFTNEDHLHVHTKKHDMALQLGFEQKTMFVADQTPTPTRFIRNCEEVGLFQDLQNCNPFDEGFKRAVETKQGMVCLENQNSSAAVDDSLHTPQMVCPLLVFPLLESGEVYSTTNNQRNITISRSSSDESGKGYETTTISKLTNEVTTISRVIEKHDMTDKHTDNKATTSNELTSKDVINETVSYMNNVIKIHNNVNTRIDVGSLNCGSDVPSPRIVGNIINNMQNINDNVKDNSEVSVNACNKSISNASKSIKTGEVAIKPKSDNYKRVLKRNHSEANKTNAPFSKTSKSKGDSKAGPLFENTEGLEVTIKLPNGKCYRMKADDDESKKPQTVKEILKEKQKTKVDNTLKTLPNLAPVTLIPVQIVNPVLSANMNNNKINIKKEVTNNRARIKIENSSPSDKECRVAASRRYRERLKAKTLSQLKETSQLKSKIIKLEDENRYLKDIISTHIGNCPKSEELKMKFALINK